MNAGPKLAAFAAVLAATFAGAMVVGAAVGPIDVNGDDTHSSIHVGSEAPHHEEP